MKISLTFVCWLLLGYLISQFIQGVVLRRTKSDWLGLGISLVAYAAVISVAYEFVLRYLHADTTNNPLMIGSTLGSWGPLSNWMLKLFSAAGSYPAEERRESKPSPKEITAGSD